jgi:hypothetical protein
VKLKILLALVLAISVAAVVYKAYQYTSVSGIDIKVDLGIVDPVSSKPTRVAIRINRAEGSASFPKVIELVVQGNGTYVKLVPRVSHVDDGVAVLLSGEVLLERNGRVVHRIPMPCLLAVGVECFRIMQVIPGYDEPLYLDRSPEPCLHVSNCIKSCRARLGSSRSPAGPPTGALAPLGNPAVTNRFIRIRGL